MPSSHTYTALQLIAKALGLATTIAIVRTAPASDVGMYFIAITGAGIVAIVIEMGGGKGALLAAAHGSSYGPYMGARRHVAVSVVAIGTVVGLAPTVNHGQRLAAMVGAIGGLLALNAIAEGTLLGAGTGRNAATGNVIFNLVTLIAAVAWSFTSAAIVSVALVTIYWAGAGAASLYYHRVLRSNGFGGLLLPTTAQHALVPGFGTRTAVEQHSRLICIVSLLAIMYFRMDLLLLASLATKAQVAFYGATYRLIEIGIGGIHLLAAARQRSAAQAKDAAARSRSLDETLGVLSSISSFAGLALLVAAPVLPRIFGPSYGATPRLLSLLCPGMLGVALQGAASVAIATSLSITAETARILKLSGASVLVGLIFATIGYKLGMINGLAAGLSVAELLLGAAIFRVVAGGSRGFSQQALLTTAGGLLSLVAAASSMHPIVIGAPLILPGLHFCIRQRQSLRELASTW